MDVKLDAYEIMRNGFDFIFVWELDKWLQFNLQS